MDKYIQSGKERGESTQVKTQVKYKRQEKQKQEMPIKTRHVRMKTAK